MKTKFVLLLSAVLMITGCGKFNGETSDPVAAVRDLSVTRFSKGQATRIDRFYNTRTGFHESGYGNSAGEFLANFTAITSEVHVDGPLGTGFQYPGAFNAVHKLYACQNYGLGPAITFTSADPGCEGYGSGPILAWVGNRQNGTTPNALYRCINPGNGDHLDTMSPNVECNGNGYKVEGILGYLH